MLYTENIGLRDCSGLLQIGSHMFAMEVLFTKFMKISSLENSTYTVYTKLLITMLLDYYTQQFGSNVSID